MMAPRYARVYLTVACVLCLRYGTLVQAFTASWRPARAVPTAARVPVRTSLRRYASPTGADIEQPLLNDATRSDIPMSADSDIPSSLRGKVNEIDYCIAPADVSLSRAYRSVMDTTSSVDTSLVGLSLTRALNNASNRAVRRILLARSWPSATALNQSLRQVAFMGTRASPISKTPTSPPRRTDAEYVADQLQSFATAYGTLPGYEAAQDFLECVLSLATTGVEHAKVATVRQARVYDEAYQRVVSVLTSGGVEFIPVDTVGRRIAPTLKDQDICWSMLDTLELRREATRSTAYNGEVELNDTEDDTDETMVTPNEDTRSERRNPFLFWQRPKSKPIETPPVPKETTGVLVSSKEPTMTRQLNVLSNIVQRMLLYGGDQELLVLAVTLEADTTAFTHQWYPERATTRRPGLEYLQCLIALLRQCQNQGLVTDLDPPKTLLTSYANAYERLVATAVERGSGYLKPPSFFPTMDPSTATSVTSATTTTANNPTSSTAPGLLTMPKPRTAQEELGRFAVWESNVRQSAASSSLQSRTLTNAQPAYSPYPADLVGSWLVRDEIVGETIGTATVTFLEQGAVQLAPPLQGLQWRLDPGPTHLDTCTFQVLSLDGTILQYRGFIDRGARLEARFSKRVIQIRGSVMFQNLRDGNVGVDYYKDMLPINYRTGTTNFVMIKQSESR